MNPTFINDMSWRMGEVYAAVTDQLLINLARHFKYIKDGAEIGGAWSYQIRKLAEMGQVTRESEQIILNMLGDADAALQAILEESIREGLKGVEKPLKQASEKGLLLGQGFLPPEMAPNQMQAFRAYYRQSADKLNLVNTVMLESTQKAYQATVSDIVTRMSATQDILNVGTGEVVSGVTSMNQAVRQSVQKMVENGITGFIDHGGHHWSPEAYVTMDIRTTMANTAREAVFERNEQYGNDLYQVSWHDGARPLCYPWQGKVISRDNNSREVEDLDGNLVHVYAQSETTYGEVAGLFGINCGHYPIPFIPGFSKIRPPQQNEEQNSKEYEESQKQRQLERKLREEKRDLSVLKAQGASDEEIKAQRLKVKNARDNLNDFCDETGRARRTGREQTPIKADWPVIDQKDSLQPMTSNVKMNSKLDAEGNITAPMSENRYSRMKEGLEKHGVEIVQAEGDDLRFLMARGAEASYWDGRITHVGEIPSSSAMFEETIHAAQARIYGEQLETNPVELAAREIAAQEKLLKNGKAYGFTADDYADIQANRDYLASSFEKLTGKEYDPNDKTSEFYRGV